VNFKRAKLVIALRNCLLIFAVFFVLTGIAGYIHGNADAKADFPIRVALNTSIKEIDGGYCLVYRLHNQDMYAFDIGTQRLIPYVATRIEGKTEDERAPVTGIFFKNADVVKTVGATAVTFLLRDIYRASAFRRAVARNKWAPRWLQLVAGLGGAVGGYQVGHWIGYRPNQSEEERLARSRLSDQRLGRRRCNSLLYITLLGSSRKVSTH
jgi:hypothetical protein